MAVLRKSVCLRGRWGINCDFFFPFCTVAMELRTDMPRNTKSARHRSSKPPGHFPCKSNKITLKVACSPVFLSQVVARHRFVARLNC